MVNDDHFSCSMVVIHLQRSQMVSHLYQDLDLDQVRRGSWQSVL